MLFIRCKTLRRYNVARNVTTFLQIFKLYNRTMVRFIEIPFLS